MAKQARSSLVFACGARAYAVPAEQAFEVVTLGPLTGVPGGAAHLRGLLAHRGEVIPVIDLGVLRDGVAVDTDRAVIVRVDKDVLALTLTHVDGIATLQGTGTAASEVGFASLLRGPLRSGAREDVFSLDAAGLVAWLHQSGSSST